MLPLGPFPSRVYFPLASLPGAFPEKSRELARTFRGVQLAVGRLEQPKLETTDATACASLVKL